ncbi:hypothetical protein [Desulfonatronovibrio magnus]|uniref:hypothetical protein n=1 Tax=Desulfonatronovibrio magnus TaxID=698827 RepID=UPI0005EB81DA|nr:hypothetical protein [Desulfonatronovibrio magnus]RQD59739.1 MAG: hypothetical protein D5R98_07245 [Desulfonatronovibrio sp. MSAO_Bac4]
MIITLPRASVLMMSFLLILLTAPAYAWQAVTVELRVDEEALLQTSASQLRDRALSMGFQKAVRQEVVRIMPEPVGEDRLSSLMKHIDDVEALVQAYRGVVWNEHDAGMDLQMQVLLETETLRNILQRIGIYYTGSTQWPYDLSTRGASPDDFARLMELQMVTGVVVDSEAGTSLSLNRSLETGWTGTIAYGSHKMSASGYDLSNVWFDLWEFIFSLSDFEAFFVDTVVLNTNGWTTMDSIHSFDTLLKAWEREIEYGKIISVTAGIPDLEAVWIVQTLSIDSLQARLEGYFSGRDIKFEISLP